MKGKIFKNYVLLYYFIIQCKEKMRPVKKALKALDTPDMSLSEEERVARARRCLFQIGNHINTCLTEYKTPEQVGEWKSNLWYFASKFTNFKAKKLYRMYKNLVKQGGDSNGGTTSSPDKKEDASTTTYKVLRVLNFLFIAIHRKRK